jgi:hypothetical protein
MGKNDRRNPTTRGSWRRNPFYSPDLEWRASQDELWSGTRSLLRHDPYVWVEDDDTPKSKPGPKPFISDEQAEKAIGWLLEQPGRLNRKDVAICGDLEKMLGIHASKTVWRKRVIGPAGKMRR